MSRITLLLALVLSTLSLAAEARPRPRPAPPAEPCFIFCAAEPATSTSPRSLRSRGEVLGGRPAGCPRAFCGCGASLEVFGRIIPHLNLAANWLRFPRTAPAGGMVAARRGHVFVLKAPTGRANVWLVKDYNSGGGRVRLHERSLAGYTIVDPRGA